MTTYYRISYHVKINLLKNLHSKNHNDKAFVYIKKFKINKFKMDVRTFGHNYRVDTLSTFYLTASEVIIPNLKSIDQL